MLSITIRKTIFTRTTDLYILPNEDHVDGLLDHTARVTVGYLWPSLLQDHETQPSAADREAISV